MFDAIQLKAAATVSLADRVRMNNLALSIPMLSQGIPFFHAGDDILRSKSLDRNSYDSGDWFNRLDWTLQTDNWGVGLPIEGTDRYEIYRPLLANPALKPGKSEITFSFDVFKEFLEIRKSSSLFRLQTGDQVKEMVSFLNNGPEQIPDLIVMRIEDKQSLDSQYGEIVVLINSGKSELKFGASVFTRKQYSLHPVQSNSVDDVVKTAVFDSSKPQFIVPGYSTAVFVSIKPAQPAATVPAVSVQPSPIPQPMPQPSLHSTTLLLAGSIFAAIILIAVALAYMASRKKG
jgi:pullulanase/glycogen debranching enzyme